MKRCVKPVVAILCSLVLVVACNQVPPRESVSYTIQLAPGSSVDAEAVQSALAGVTQVDKVVVEPSTAQVRLETVDRRRIDRDVIEAAMRPIGLVVQDFREPHAEFCMLRVGGGG